MGGPELGLAAALHGAVALAALAQAVTGIGFGLLAGPALLAATGETSAMAATALLGLLVALALLPGRLASVDRAALRALCAGGAAGLPFGIGLFAMADAAALQLAAGAVLLALLPALARAPRPAGEAIGWRHGLLPGILGGALAMPGPAAALALAAGGRPGPVLRATVLAFFLPACAAILAGQAWAGALRAESLADALRLAPAVLLGAVAGSWLASRVSERRVRLPLLVLTGLLAAALVIEGGRGVAEGAA